MQFTNRWRISGTLTTRSEVHIGDGGITHRNDLIEKLDVGRWRKIEIAATATDHQQRAYIPGMTLKGNLRSWLKGSLAPTSLIESLLGSENQAQEGAQGGKAEFWDATFSDESVPLISAPYWNADRLTGVTASVALDRQTRTSSRRKLFHNEFIPPGVRFHLSIAGQNLEDDEVALLLFALNGFNNPDHPITIGADNSNQWGQFNWELEEVAWFTKEHIDAWLNSDTPAVGYNALVPVPQIRYRELSDLAKQFTRSVPLQAELTCLLHFDSPFLVNDPSQTRKPDDPQDADEVESAEIEGRKPDHAPLRDDAGRILLPPRSIRGAFRSQAERIIRTFNSQAACSDAGGSQPCGAIYRVSEVEKKLCLACQLFGTPGWRSPIHFSKFVSIRGEQDPILHQEFVAIDRFTGGAAEEFKFNADSALYPILQGSVSLELCREYQESDQIKRWIPAPWMIGLLILTIRDLMEGDIRLGFGAAKGYGTCHAVIENIKVVGIEKVYLAQALERIGVSQLDLASLDIASIKNGKIPEDDILVMADLIDEFGKAVDAFSVKES